MNIRRHEAAAPIIGADSQRAGRAALRTPNVLLAIDIGATKTTLAWTTDVAHVLRRRRFSTRELLASYPDPAAAIARLIESARDEDHSESEQFDSVVVGIPGVIDRRAETVASCPNLPELDGVMLGPILAERLGVTVIIENDVNVAAIGEQSVGRGRGIDDVACIFVGSGVGCGLVLGGRLYLGADGTAGEFGHTVIEAHGRKCTCGGRGCLEMYCSGKALAGWAASAGLAPADPSRRADEFHGAEGVINAAHQGDPRAIAALDEAFASLGVGIVNLVNLVNPRLVLLGGGLMTGWPDGLGQVRDIVRTRSRLVARDRVEIDRTMLGGDAFAAGAARLGNLPADGSER